AGAGGFTAPMGFAAGVNPQSVAIEDLNGDLAADLAIAGGSTTISVSFNQCASSAFTNSGFGCAGSGGLVPQLVGLGTPSPGGSVGLAITHGKPASQGLLILGTAPAAISIQKCT